MFTGLVEAQGTVCAVENLGDSLILTCEAPSLLGDVSLGDSISVNGVCLTVMSFDEKTFTAHLMAETLRRSTFGSVAVGDPVNMERALSVRSRLGGHIVQGHVDGVAELLQREHGEHWDVLRFSLPHALRPYVVEKGSIAVSGVSLTVSALSPRDIRDKEEEFFEVSLIPATLSTTILGQLPVGGKVNLEVDIVAKYVENMLQYRDASL